MSNVFKGDLKVTNQSLMGKADVKKLRASLLAEFPSLSKKALDVILGKDELGVHKCSNGTTLYVPGDGPPTLFDDGFGCIFPTLTTLWRLPGMMPELVTHPPVSKFLLPRERSAGADMMLPGVIVPEGGLDDVHIGQKRCIRVEGNAMPIAVGKMIVGAAEIEAGGMKGKGMEVKHVYHDSLWAYSGRKVPNDGFLETEVVASDGLAPSAAEVAAPPAEESDNADEPDDEPPAEADAMSADKLMEYCFFAAFKTTCTDAELPLSADRFYSHHMQPARPLGQPPLDAKKSSFKQIGKFLKAQHKAKLIAVREVKNIITLLSVDRHSKEYVEFELRGGAASLSTRTSNSADAGANHVLTGAPAGAGTRDEDVALRTKPPVVSDAWQPNSYTKALFSAVGRDKAGFYTAEEAHAVLEAYVQQRAAAGAGGAAAGGTSRAPAASVPTWLVDAGVPVVEAEGCAAKLSAGGYDSVRAMCAPALPPADLEQLSLTAPHAAAVAAAVADEVRAFLGAAGVPPAEAESAASSLAADGFDSVRAMRAAALQQADLATYRVPAACVDAVAQGLSRPPVASANGGAGGSSVDAAAVPLDELLLESLVKVAGGAKKGTTYPTHLSLDDLQARLIERMSPFHKVVVEGEAPLYKKGTLKLIQVQMKRAAGHNKTHIIGLESFLIPPDAVAQALKLRLGCTTAVLKLPGNNVKEHEVLLQGHCVNEVVEHLASVYAIDKKWIVLPKKN